MALTSFHPCCNLCVEIVEYLHEESAFALALRLDGDHLKMIPHRNLGGKGGFEPILEQIVELPFSSSPAEIGRAVIDSIGRCE